MIITSFSKSVHPSWNGLFTEQIVSELSKIEEGIDFKNSTPNKDRMLRFLELDLNKVNVIVLGMDPYPEKGVATGRSFEVGNLISWQEKFNQNSIRNMVSLIYADYKNQTTYPGTNKFDTIRDEIKQGEFPIVEPNKWFDNLETQGVLFLNTGFSLLYGSEQGKNPHMKLWSKFTQELLKYISTKNPDACWFLWGRKAQSYKKYIYSSNLYESRHPAYVSSKNKDDFLWSSCFRDTSNIFNINWLG